MAGSWQTGVEKAWADLGDFLPRLLLALAVFVAGWVLAVVLKKVVDLLMERSASRRDPRSRVSTVAVRARRAAPRLVHLAVMLVALWTAIEVIDPGSGESPAADFVDALRGLLLVLGLAALFTVSAVVVVGVGGGLVRPMEDRWEVWLGRVGTARASDQSQPEQSDSAEHEQAPVEPDHASAREPDHASARSTARLPRVPESDTSADDTSDAPSDAEPERPSGETAGASGRRPRAADETQVLPASSVPREPRR